MNLPLSSIGQNVNNFCKEFKDLNWLRISARFEQCFILIVFKFINVNCQYYVDEVFKFVPESNVSLRNKLFKLK